MQIDKEIQSDKFEDNYHRAVVNILFTYGWLGNLMRGQFERHNITQQQFNVLRILRGQYPETGYGKSDQKSGMIDKMSDRFPYCRSPGSKTTGKPLHQQRKDRRSVDIRISEQGLDILAKIDKEYHRPAICFIKT